MNEYCYFAAHRPYFLTLLSSIDTFKVQGEIITIDPSAPICFRTTNQNIILTDVMLTLTKAKVKVVFIIFPQDCLGDVNKLVLPSKDSLWHAKKMRTNDSDYKVCFQAKECQMDQHIRITV